MSQRFMITDLDAAQLNNRSLMILRKLMRTLYSKKGITLKFSDRDLLKTIFFHVYGSDDSELSSLSAHLRVALKEYVLSPDFAHKRTLIMHQLQQRKDIAIEQHSRHSQHV